ncbi:uncharacterized protein C53C9.2-like, partial [Mus caroli]|uniref:Uncharacterized protein C53C9.2-like n=1 Tax=Mus caroli TaxID=10089 RepID=A0A6P5P5W2_MUSCR
MTAKSSSRGGVESASTQWPLLVEQLSWKIRQSRISWDTFNAAQSRIDRMAKEDGIMPEQAFTNKPTPAGNHSMGPLRTSKKRNIPVNTPDRSPSQETHIPHKECSSDNDTDCLSADVEMEVAENEPTSLPCPPCYLRYGSMVSLYQGCRSTQKAALSAIYITENIVMEEEGQEEEKMEEEEEAEEEEKTEEGEVEEEEEEEEEKMEE